MLAIVNVILPVFAIVLLGYGAVRLRLFPSDGIRGLLTFVNNFATPCLLFEAMVDADFGQVFNLSIIVPYYIGALLCFAIGIVVSLKLFRARPGESVAWGFSGTFTNTVLIGIPVIGRAYGTEGTTTAFSIIGFHSPLLLTIGMLVMELMRRDGDHLGKALLAGLMNVLRNPLVWGIALGALANFTGLDLPEPGDAFVAMMASAVLPASLFGLGGALTEYRLSDNWAPSAIMASLKLILHPLIAYVLMVPILHVDPLVARYGILLSAMPAGLNAYIFATLYDRGASVAATTVLFSTVASIVTLSVWLLVLG